MVQVAVCRHAIFNVRVLSICYLHLCFCPIADAVIRQDAGSLGFSLNELTCACRDCPVSPLLSMLHLACTSTYKGGVTLLTAIEA